MRSDRILSAFSNVREIHTHWLFVQCFYGRRPCSEAVSASEALQAGGKATTLPNNTSLNITGHPRFGTAFFIVITPKKRVSADFTLPKFTPFPLRNLLILKVFLD